MDQAQQLDICPHWNPDNITDSLHGRLVYKDECCRCFASPKSASGLDVCLRCFVGSCCPSDEPALKNHSCIHFSKTEHPIVVRIFKTPKKVDEPVKVTKLAIGKPGGIDPETDNFETSVKVYCHSCKAYLDHSNEKISPMVDSILLAQSAFDQSAVEEWELEINPCEHTLTLDQTGSSKIAEKVIAHCNECELKSNLWLCLTCGHLGCGRQNYDKTGGNNHGVEHFEKTGHGVNVKIGTITPEGKASIHCYKCDEEVIDNDLAAHLGVLGIEITNQVKTEKSIAE
jgi:ubiquitin carboxyl-terminal hydrolase 5/13